jgi:hypothetical protein
MQERGAPDFWRNSLFRTRHSRSWIKLSLDSIEGRGATACVSFCSKKANILRRSALGPPRPASRMQVYFLSSVSSPVVVGPAPTAIAVSHDGGFKGSIFPTGLRSYVHIFSLPISPPVRVLLIK